MDDHGEPMSQDERLSPLGAEMVAGLSGYCDVLELTAEIARLRAENDRLKATIKDIGEWTNEDRPVFDIAPAESNRLWGILRKVHGLCMEAGGVASATPPIRDWYADVLSFHRTFCPEQIGTVPKVPSDEVCLLRSRLVLEEYEEFEWAMDLDKIPEMADAIADLIYVLLGTAIAYGIDMRPVWEAVQASNLAKVGGGRRADGKVQKCVGWQPPDIAGILERQGPIT